MKKYSYLLIAAMFLLSWNNHQHYNAPLSECEGGALQFDGVDDYVRVEHPFYEFTNQITVEWWANFDPNADLGSGIGQADPAQDDWNTNVWLMYIWDNKIHFAVVHNGNVPIAQAEIVSGWHHWTGVADATSVRLYMDGIQVGTVAAGISQITNSPNSVIDFGKDVRYFEDRWMKGEIDEVRVWNTALSQATIQQWMNQPLNSSHSNYSNLQGYWKLDEVSGTTAFDSSPQQNHGTLFGGTARSFRTQPCKENSFIVDFTLINAATNNDIMKLRDGDTLNLAALQTTSINIRANTNPAEVGSVVFYLDGPLSLNKVENIAPYTLFGDNSTDKHSSGIPPEGWYTLTTTPYSEGKGTGVKGTARMIQFYVIYQEVNSFTLINAETDKEIRTIKNGDVIDLSTLPTHKLNIRANTAPANVGSVVFNLNGKVTVVENFSPYAIGGDIAGNYRAWTLPVGKHTLTATPYQYSNGTGLKGKAHKVTFTVVDPTATYRITASGRTSEISEEGTPGASLGALPNPFSSTTTISFSVPQSGYTSVQLYNSSGALMKNVYQAQAEKGVVYRLPLQSKALQGGVYMLRLTSGAHLQSYKLVLAR